MDDFDEDRERNKDGTMSCGVFIPLPFDLAKDFPDKSHEDDSVPHLTILYAGNLGAQDYAKFVNVVGRVCRSVKPFTMDLAHYSEFINKNDQTIAHMVPGFTGSSILARLHGMLRREVEAEGIKLEHNYGPMDNPLVPYEVKFIAHATLNYMKPGEMYRGPKPTGSWKVTELECWGYDKYRLPLGRNKIDQPTGLTRTQLTGPYPRAVTESSNFPYREILRNHQDKIPGGLGDKLKPTDVDKKQLAMGIKVELEHTKDWKRAREIALDHLKEDPKYYAKLKKIEPHHEAETSLKGDERHPSPMGGFSNDSGGLGLSSDPRYADWLDKINDKKVSKLKRSKLKLQL